MNSVSSYDLKNLDYEFMDSLCSMDSLLMCGMIRGIRSRSNGVNKDDYLRVLSGVRPIRAH